MSTGAMIGRDGLLEWSSKSTGTYVAVGGIRNYSFDASADEIDGGSFDSGGWGNKLPGQKSASLTAEAVHLSSGGQQDKIIDWFSSDTVRWWRIRFSTHATIVAPNFKGPGRVLSYSVSADRNDIVLMNFSIGYTGAITATTAT